MKTPLLRRLEVVVAWVTVAFAGCAAVLGLLGPLLGGLGPGLPGPVGFAVEMVAALWLPGGVLTAVVAATAMLRRLRWPGAALAALALAFLVPEVWVWVRAPLVKRGNGPVLRVAAVNLCAENGEDPLMEESLRRIDADVLVLTEFTNAWARRLERWFAGDYPHRWLGAAPEIHGAHTDGLNVAIWSRLPAAGAPEVRHPKGNPMIRVPLLWHDRTFAVYGVHPWKPYPYRLYRSAWRDRQHLLEWLYDEPLPAVVAGDFNASPRSPFLRRLRGLGLANASEAACGYAPTTWPMQTALLAPVRVAIDHVLHSEAFVAVDFHRGKATNSDHAPVFAELQWRNE